jgi:predicted RNA-binding Zn-ribbon protein involved in translation (DUF1610 family)
VPRKSRNTVTAADLATTCTACQYPIPPAEIVHVDSDHLRCPKCGAQFIPIRKGNWSQLGN